MKRTAWPRLVPPTFSCLKPKNFTAPVERASGAIKREPVRASMTLATGRAEAIPKDDAVRNEEYRRLVATLPCKHCGIVGYSQAAHLPPDGKGIKQDDRQIFALCCARVGITGCHADYDNYRLFSRPVAMTVGLAWAADTRRQITAMGQWPANLPRIED